MTARIFSSQNFLASSLAPRSVIWSGKVLENSTPPSCQRFSNAARRSSGETSIVGFGCATCGEPPPLRHDNRRRSA